MSDRDDLNEIVDSSNDEGDAKKRPRSKNDDSDDGNNGRNKKLKKNANKPKDQDDLTELDDESAQKEDISVEGDDDDDDEEDDERDDIGDDEEDDDKGDSGDKDDRSDADSQDKRRKRDRSGKSKKKKNRNDRKGKKKRGSRHQRETRANVFEDEVEEDDNDESEANSEAEIPKTHRPEDNLLNQPRRNRELEIFKMENEQDFQERYKGESIDDREIDEVEYRNQFPGANDPKIFQVELTKPGSEYELVSRLMHKFTLNPQETRIVSAFALPQSQKGYIFVEAYNRIDVIETIRGMMGLKDRSVQVVQKTDVPNVFRPKEKDGKEVRAKRLVRVQQTGSKFDGDLALVESVNVNKRTARLRLIPREYPPEEQDRIDQEEREMEALREQRGVSARPSKKEENENKNDEQGEGEDKKGNKGGFKRKKAKKYTRENRPPQVLADNQDNALTRKQRANQDDDEKDGGAGSGDEKGTKGNMYKRKYELKDFAYNYIQTENIDPTPEELCLFFNESSLQRVIENHAQFIRYTNFGETIFQVGEIVRVVSGDFVNLRGKVKGTEQRADGKYVKIKPFLTEKQALLRKDAGENPPIEVQAMFLIKEFKAGQDVRVTRGRYKEHIGQVLETNTDNETATILTQNQNQITVRLNDLVMFFSDQTTVSRTAAESAASARTQAQPSQQAKSGQQQGQYEQNSLGITRGDLVRLKGVNGAGYILNVTGGSYRILKSTNEIQTITEMQFTEKLDTRRTVVKNLMRDDIKKGDVVIILNGAYKDVQSRVEHVFEDVLFLFSEQFSSDYKIAVEKVNNVTLQVRQPGREYKKPNLPVSLVREQQSKVQEVKQLWDSGAGADRPAAQAQRKLFPGEKVTIKKGQYKGYDAIIRNIIGEFVQVEIPARNKIEKIAKSYLFTDQEKTLDPGKTPAHPGLQSVRDNSAGQWGSSNLTPAAPPRSQYISSSYNNGLGDAK